MADLSRLYDFTAGTTIVSSEVDAELNQLVARINDIDADSLASALAERLGVSQTGSKRSEYVEINTEQARTNTAYGTLTTPDQVSSLVVTAGDVVRVRYWAQWKESVDGASRAAIFIGSNQLKVAKTDTAAPVAQEAENGATVGSYYPLSSGSIGLFSAPQGVSGATAYTGDVTTGQALDIAAQTDEGRYGTVCEIFGLAAGTYTISVQFKASSGTVTVKNRKLWVEVASF